MSEQQAAKKSDLGTRTLSALIMLVVTGIALWLGGWWWTILVVLVAAGVLYEWRRLVRQFTPEPAAQASWMLAGILYLGVAAATLMFVRDQEGLSGVLVVLLMVIGTDVGAYFAGRTFGGPKIAPKISPSKTWAGLIGGIIGASAAILFMQWAWASGLCDALNPAPILAGGEAEFDGPCSAAYMPPLSYLIFQVGVAGTSTAIVAQAGDFFESWMKRRAGVKDSSNLIPGHGGLFDRVDGLLAVSFVLGILFIVGRWMAPL